jgi:hypothetical protein
MHGMYREFSMKIPKIHCGSWIAVFSKFSQTRLVVVSAILPNYPDSE